MEKNMTSLTIKPAALSDETAAVDVVPLAFSADPVAQWLHPHPTLLSVLKVRLERQAVWRSLKPRADRF